MTSSFRQMHLAALVIVALFTLIVAWRTKSVFAWVTAGAAVLTVVISYQSLIPLEAGEA